MKNLDVLNAAVSLILKAALLASRWSGRARRRSLERLAAADADAKDKELLFLRDKVFQLEMQLSLLLKRTSKRNRRYTVRDKLFILAYMETFQIPRRRVTEYFGIARSTLYRWLHKIEDRRGPSPIPANKTPVTIAALVWEITKVNVGWGRVRIANQLALLNIFIAASTVRNILNRPQPCTPPATTIIPEAKEDKPSPPIPAWYPNHVWSADTTTFLVWGLWPTHIFIAIDHYSRRVMAVKPLEGPNEGCILDALEQGFAKFGAPKHIITDHASVFVGAAFAELLDRWDVKPRLGAVGKHGSIAVTERVIKSLKYDWLKRLPIIRGFDHLAELCHGFDEWYNEWRPHMGVDGRRPADVFRNRESEKPTRDAKTVPDDIECRVFPESRVTGYRLRPAA